jgi:hypothetical protein
MDDLLRNPAIEVHITSGQNERERRRRRLTGGGIQIEAGALQMKSGVPTIPPFLTDFQ